MTDNPTPANNKASNPKALKRNAVKLLARQREKQVMELRLAGYPWETIAEQVGFTCAASAYKSWKRCIDRIPTMAVEEVRMVESLKLDRLQRSLWADAIQNKNVEQITAILKIMARKAALLGLDVKVNPIAETSITETHNYTAINVVPPAGLPPPDTDIDDIIVS